MYVCTNNCTYSEYADADVSYANAIRALRDVSDVLWLAGVCMYVCMHVNSCPSLCFHHAFIGFCIHFYEYFTSYMLFMLHTRPSVHINTLICDYIIFAGPRGCCRVLGSDVPGQGASTTFC